MGERADEPTEGESSEASDDGTVPEGDQSSEQASDPEPAPPFSATPQPEDDATQIIPQQPEPAEPSFAAPEPTASPRRRTAVIVGAVVAAVVLLGCGIGGWLLYQNIAEERAHEEGKCIKRVNNDRAESVSCDDDDAYEIFERFNDTEDEDECPTEETELIFVNESKEYVLCLKRP